MASYTTTYSRISSVSDKEANLADVFSAVPKNLAASAEIAAAAATEGVPSREEQEIETGELITLLDGFLKYRYTWWPSDDPYSLKYSLQTAWKERKLWWPGSPLTAIGGESAPLVPQRERLSMARLATGKYLIRFEDDPKFKGNNSPTNVTTLNEGSVYVDWRPMVRETEDYISGDEDSFYETLLTSIGVPSASDIDAEHVTGFLYPYEDDDGELLGHYQVIVTPVPTDTVTIHNSVRPFLAKTTFPEFAEVSYEVPTGQYSCLFWIVGRTVDGDIALVDPEMDLHVPLKFKFYHQFIDEHFPLFISQKEEEYTTVPASVIPQYFTLSALILLAEELRAFAEETATEIDAAALELSPSFGSFTATAMLSYGEEITAWEIVSPGTGTLPGSEAMELTSEEVWSEAAEESEWEHTA